MFVRHAGASVGIFRACGAIAASWMANFATKLLGRSLAFFVGGYFTLVHWESDTFVFDERIKYAGRTASLLELRNPAIY